MGALPSVSFIAGALNFTNPDPNPEPNPNPNSIMKTIATTGAIVLT